MLTTVLLIHTILIEDNKTAAHRTRNECQTKYENQAALSAQCRALVAAWRTYFEHRRPHFSFACLTPVEYTNRSKEDQNLNRANLN